MENRYLFRAKRIDNGKWTEGKLFDDGFENGRIFIGGLVIEEYHGTACDKWNITGIDFCEADPSTICQCTGLKDKNGKLIWENDIVVTVYDGNQNPNYVVIWDKDDLGFLATNGKDHYETNFEYLGCCEEIEVIGNIFDNPELLEQEG